MYESTKGAPHQKNYTKLSLPSVSLEKFPFQSICLQALIVHGDEVTKYRSSSRFPQNFSKTKAILRWTTRVYVFEDFGQIRCQSIISPVFNYRKFP